MLERRRKEFSTFKGIITTYEAQLQAPEFLETSLRFACLTMTWLIRICDPRHLYPAQEILLPLPESVPEQFSMLPEYYMEVSLELFVFALR